MAPSRTNRPPKPSLEPAPATAPVLAPTTTSTTENTLNANLNSHSNEGDVAMTDQAAVASPSPAPAAGNGSVASVGSSAASAREEVYLGAAGREQRIRILPGAQETAASFEFKKEDHTLGNALRYIIMKNPEVEFCGYSIPHPSEDVMNIRIQTYDGTTAVDALAKGFDDLIDFCDIVAEKFMLAREEFAGRMEEDGPASPSSSSEDRERDGDGPEVIMVD